MVTCPDGYVQNSVKWKNEMNGNQNNYEFKRTPSGVIFEKIWPGGYFGPGPELQIDFCCKQVSEESLDLDFFQENLNSVNSNSEISTNKTGLAISENESNANVPEPLVVMRLNEEVTETLPENEDFRMGLVKYGDYCPLVNEVEGLPAWFDFPTEKNNNYSAFKFFGSAP